MSVSGCVAAALAANAQSIGRSGRSDFFGGRILANALLIKGQHKSTKASVVMVPTKELDHMIIKSP